jgi:putative heme transporter
MPSVVARPASAERLRRLGFVLFGLVLIAAVWSQRTTIVDAVGQLHAMPISVVALLLLLGLAERAVRVDIYSSLMGVGFTDATVVHEVGAAASKGVPMGGAVGTALRWSIARERSIPTSRFTVALIATGVASVFVTWTMPLIALGADLTQRSAEPTDLIVLAVCATVVLGVVAAWTVSLGSDRIHRWTMARGRWVRSKLGRRFPAAEVVDTDGGIDDVRAGLQSVAARPWGLVGKTAIAQICSVMVLFVALRSLGVGQELGSIEFFRAFFIVTMLGSFVPTPGGVGVMEAGLTGALVAAGAAPSAALAAVLVYRLITYVMPIVLGAALYVVWRRAAARAVPEAATIEMLPAPALVQPAAA